MVAIMDYLKFLDQWYLETVKLFLKSVQNIPRKLFLKLIDRAF